MTFNIVKLPIPSSLSIGQFLSVSLQLRPKDRTRSNMFGRPSI